MKNLKGYQKTKRFLGVMLIAVMLFESVAANTSLSWAAETVAGESARMNESIAEETYEDLTVSSDYVLEENTVVNDLIVENHSMDLNGYQLKVMGNIRHSGGKINFNKGEMLCKGDYTLDGDGSLVMNNQNDYFCVEGDFTYQSLYDRQSMNAGIIEIKGDFTQKKHSDGNESNFIPTGTHKVILSGSKCQKVHFDSPTSYFNQVVLQNTSEKGIQSDGLINSISMERNSTVIVTETDGTYGWKLSRDEIFEGDLLLIGDTLDLNGYSLTVKGNLIHMNGSIHINEGCLSIEGDYRLQRVLKQDGEYGASSAVLSMLEAEDRLIVGGDFVTESTISHNTYLQQGIVEVMGDVIQKKYNKDDNLAMTSDITLLLSGNQRQVISIESSKRNGSRLAGFEITNPTGVRLESDIYVFGNVVDHGNPVTGKGLVLQKETTFADGSFQGNIVMIDSFVIKNLNMVGGNIINYGNLTLGTDLTVKGNFETRYEFALGGNRLEVMGDTKILRNLVVDGGELICDGNLELLNGSEYGSNLCMGYESDYVLVEGDFYANSTGTSNSMRAGTLELKGNFEHTTPKSKGNMCAVGTHRTVFSGKSLQTVRFADGDSYFNEVEILNTSEAGVYAPDGINCISLKRNGNKLTTDIEGEFGWKLAQDEIYEGDLYLISDELDLNGHSLRVTGNLIQSAGTVNVNGGELLVEGDYRIQTETKKEEETAYEQSLGYLQMTNENDKVRVNGSFVMGSVYSHAGKLAAGELSVKGDLSAVLYNAADNFVTTGSHLLTLNGSGTQKVNLSEPSFSKMRIANLKLANESEEGIIFENNFPVTGHVYSNGMKPEGYLLISSSTTFENGEYTGNILSNWGERLNLSTLHGNLVIKGGLTLQKNLSIFGNVSIENGSLDLGGKELNVSGDLTLAYDSSGGSYLVMRQKEDYLLVNGDFYACSKTMSPTGLTAGVLEIKGNFVHTKTMYDDGFMTGVDCRVLFSGDRLQTVNFDSQGSYFSYVEILNTSEDGVYSEEGIHCQYLETHGNVYRTGKEGECGWTLDKDDIWEGDLVLTTGTLDLNGYELTVTGNLIQKGGNVKVNGGKLRVSGNYLIGETAETEEVTEGSWSVLLMQKKEDEVFVEGNFVMASFVNHSKYLTDGTLFLSGDLTQKVTGSQRNLATVEGFTLVLNGSGRQNIKMETTNSSCSRIANLYVNNTGEEGVFLNGMLVTGNVTVEKGKPNGELAVVATTVFTDDWYEGDVSINEKTDYKRPLNIRGNLSCRAAFMMGADVTVDGDFSTSEYCGLSGNTFQVSGNFDVSGSRIAVGSGKLFCGGTLSLQYCYRRNSGLEMTDREGYVLVEGDMKVDNTLGTAMSAGTLELKGDFIQNRYQGAPAFVPSENFVVLLSGTEKQTVYFSEKYSRFGTLSVKNESEEGVHFENDSIRALRFERNGCRITCEGSGTYGWKLSEDTVLEDDLYLIMDELDLNGYSLKINGNLYIGAGSVNVNGGKLEVTGDLRIQRYDGNGSFSESNGKLIMVNEEDCIKVGGDFVTQTAKSSENCLTAGKLEIKGDFWQKNALEVRKNFMASGTHQVIFNGDAEQTVHFEGYPYSGFMNVSFSKSEEKITFETNVRADGVIEDEKQKVCSEKGKYIDVKDLSQFKEGVFGGNVYCGHSCTLVKDMDIRGNVDSYGDIDLDGHTFTIGNLEKRDGGLFVNKGKLNLSDSLSITSNAFIIMDHERDEITVANEFTMNSLGNLEKNVLHAGVLQIGGDVTIQSAGFTPSETHRTILSGKAGNLGRNYIQEVSLTNEGARFNELVLTKEKDTFYSFSDDVSQLCRKLTMDIQDSESPSKVTGIKVQKITATSVKLSWEPASDNVEVSGYQIFRGSSQVGHTRDTSYTDTGLKPDCNYTYRICAYDAKKNLSEYSDSVSAVTESDTKAPEKPEGMKLVTRTGSSVTVGWNRADDNVGVTAYQIYRDDEQIARVAKDVFKFKDINRSPGEEHIYQVRALDGAGNESELSETVSGAAKMPVITKLVPQNGAELGGKTIELLVYYENVGNSTGNKVKFQYSTDKGENWEDINLSMLGQNTCNYSTLYSKYTWDISKIKSKECLVKAVLYDSDKNEDSVQAVYQLDTEPPLVPECVSAKSSNGTVVLSWNPSDSANCTGYEIYRSGVNTGFERIQTWNGRENTEYTDRDVKEGESYTYYVRSVDSYDQISEESEKPTVTVAKDMESPRVLALSAAQQTIHGNTSFIIKAVDNIGVAAVSLQYFYEDTWIDIGKCRAENGVGNIEFDTTAVKDGEYTFRALAEDKNGNLSEAYTCRFTVDNTGIEKVCLGEVTADSDKVRLTWKDVDDEDLAYYAIEQKKGESYTEIARESSRLGIYIRDLDPDTSYTFRVVGYDKSGNRGEPSEQLTITTKKDTVAPYVVKFDPVISYYKNTIPIEITAKDNNELGKISFSYSFDGSSWEEVDTVEAPEGKREYKYCYDMDISGFRDGVLYVRAMLYDRTGNGNKEEVIRKFSKVSSAPDPVRNISAVSKDGYIKVEWEKPAAENFASFDLYRKSGPDGKYKCIDAKTTALNYFDTEGEETEEIFYKIVVNDLAGNSSEYSREVSAQVLPDTEKPKVYGVSPAAGSKVAGNPEITALIADNRCLKNVSMEFRRKGSGDFWTEIYHKEVNADSIYAAVTWENEELDDGDYEFRISGCDRKGNMSSEYRFDYVLDSSYEGQNSSTLSPEVPGQPSEGELTEKEKPQAVLPETFSLRQGKEEIFNGSNSTGSSIVSWQWDFGNGDAAEGARVNYAYPDAGTYTLTLTVRDADGNEGSVTSSVEVCPKSCGGVAVTVKGNHGEILEKAQVYIQKEGDEKGKVYNCDAYGKMEAALNAGTYTVSAYQSGHLPLEKTVTINPGAVKKVNFVLESRELVTGTLTHRKLDVREIMELGIDLTDPKNWYVYTYQVATYWRDEPEPKKYEFQVSEGKWTYEKGSGEGNQRVAYTVARVPGTGDDHILVRYETVEYLKQMFEVELRLQNQAGEEFTITNGKGTLELPEGLSLAGMKKGLEQELTEDVPDIPGQSEQTVKWYIRGDKPGKYYIRAKYNGRLQPFDAPVNISIYDEEPVVVTEENTNTNTDDGFLDPEKETKNYQIRVVDTSAVPLKGAYVEMWYGDLSTRGITDSDGFVWLEVNEGDTRKFRLTAECKGCRDYEDGDYTINTGDYMDHIVMVDDGKKGYDDENEDYNGDFTLDYVEVNGMDVFSKKVQINSYETGNNTVKLYFNGKASEASVVIKDKTGENFVEIQKKNNLSSTNVSLNFRSNQLTKDYEMFVRAVDRETGTWHLYRLKNVSIVYQEPNYDTDGYNQELAEQCALYSALAYKVTDTVNGEPSDGFSYDNDAGFLSDRIDMTYRPENEGCLDLRQKLMSDGFVIDSDYMYVNYFEENAFGGPEDNCSYSIVHRKMWNGKVFVYVIIRGTDRIEWYGNMEIAGESYNANEEDHWNFKKAEGEVLDMVKKYIKEKELRQTDLVVTGHSRGAAVANLLAKDLIDDKENFNREGQEKYSYETVTAYTFATPCVSLKNDVGLKKYDTIFNFCFTDDFVPQVPLNSWGYQKYGRTVTADSESLSRGNAGFNQDRLRIRSENKEITYASDKTEKLISHISQNWEDVWSYYNMEIPKIQDPKDQKVRLTLYEFMHDKIAKAIVEVKCDKIRKLPLDFEIFIRAGEVDEISTIAKYFLQGSAFFENYIFDTHNIDNYYAALRNGGFDIKGFEDKNSLKSNNSTNRYLSSGVEEKEGVSSQKPGDIATMKNFLGQEVIQDDNEPTSVCELLGWEMDDTSTWKGVTITDGRITAIDLPAVNIGGTIDLSGLDQLVSLKCMYTGFEEVLLKDCSSLKELVLCENAIRTIDFSDCDVLESVTVSDNELRTIQWGDCQSLIWLNCTGNYLDTDTDESLLAVICTLKEKGVSPSYKNQRYEESVEFCRKDIDFVQELLDYGENEELLGWDREDISTWSGIIWKTADGVNYINRIEIAGKGLTGAFEISDLKYVRELVCGGNRFESLDVSGCSSLEFLNCYGGELESLVLDGNDSLRYLDCRNNCLFVEDIEQECKKIASRAGSEVYYERQYISAGRSAFSESECAELERFASMSVNKDILKWNFSKPGRIPGIRWEVRDGVYRVVELNLLGYAVEGAIDLSGFSAMKKVSFTGTNMSQIILPDSLKELSPNAFMNCRSLEQVELPCGLEIIGKRAFYNCEKLNQIELPESLTEIQDEAFVNCRSLEDLELGKGIKVLGQHVFAGCATQTPAPSDVPANTPLPDLTPEPTESPEPDVTTLPEMTPVPGKSAMPFASAAQDERQIILPGLPSDNNKSYAGKKYTVSKVKILRYKQNKRTLRVTIRRNPKISGYEVFYRKGKKGKFQVKRQKGWKKNQIVLRNLKKKKSYYIKVRAYQLIQGKKYYSAFTKCRRIMVK